MFAWVSRTCPPILRISPRQLQLNQPLYQFLMSHVHIACYHSPTTAGKIPTTCQMMPAGVPLVMWKSQVLEVQVADGGIFFHMRVKMGFSRKSVVIPRRENCENIQGGTSRKGPTTMQRGSVRTA